jgi:hypothetical protein
MHLVGFAVTSIGGKRWGTKCTVWPSWTSNYVLTLSAPTTERSTKATCAAWTKLDLQDWTQDVRLIVTGQFPLTKVGRSHGPNRLWLGTLSLDRSRPLATHIHRLIPTSEILVVKTCNHFVKVAEVRRINDCESHQTEADATDFRVSIMQQILATDERDPTSVYR